MRTLLIPLAVLALTACVEDVGKDKVKAEVAEVEPAKTPEAPPAATANALKVDPAQSKINALGAKVTATHPITWSGFTGEVAMDGDAVTGVSFTVDMNTMESDAPKLTSHLKNADFFDVPTYPNATFKSTAITAGAPEGQTGTHTVVGEFMVHGMTKQLTFPANITVAADKVTATTEFVIDRKDFGITYAGQADNLIQDNVKMNISFVAPRG